MTKNPREPKAIKALIKKHEKKVQSKAVEVENKVVIPASTLWNRIRLRKQN